MYFNILYIGKLYIIVFLSQYITIYFKLYIGEYIFLPYGRSSADKLQGMLDGLFDSSRDLLDQ